MANIQHPAGLEEGLRQSAAGEVVDLGSFEQYIPIEDRKVGEIFELSEEDKDRWANGRIYERFIITNEYGENYAEPIRPGILAEYTENGLSWRTRRLTTRTAIGPTTGLRTWSCGAKASPQDSESLTS